MDASVHSQGDRPKNRWVPGKGRERDNYPPAAQDKWQPIPLTELHQWLVDDVDEQRLEDHLDRYQSSYGGRHFEWFSSQAKERRFTSYHILAAESLSVKVPPTAARWLLQPDARRDELLKQVHQVLVPGADSLWTCDASLLSGDSDSLDSSGALYQLYWSLRNGDDQAEGSGVGPVTASKLLAARFPALVPIRDSNIEALLGLTDNDNWWLDARDLLCRDDRSLVEVLNGLRTFTDSGKVTVLRKLDIVLWMEANARQLPRRK